MEEIKVMTYLAVPLPQNHDWGVGCFKIEKLNS
jgi:hypothetical protein